MLHFPLRWALLCVAATSALLASAGASERVTIGPGDSLDSLARRFGVPKLDIARANGISVDAILRDGRKLTIPDPPRTVHKSPTMRRSARVTTDRVSVRRGPYEGHRRLALVDSGTAVVATARAGDWVQVTLAGGQNGWIRQDFVSIGKSAAEPERRTARGERPKQNRVSATRRSSTRTASATPARKPATAAKAKAARSERKAEPSRTARSSKSQTASKARTASKAQTASKARTASKAETASKQARAAEAARRTAAANRAKSRAAAAARQRERARVASASGSGEVVRSAYAYRGTPYRYGGTGRSGFDCSGFTRHIYAKKGVNLPHSARGQASRGRRVSRSELKEGDLVFFHTTRRGISHVGIYAGNGKFVHASSGGGSVRVDTLDSGYYKERFRGGRRVR